MRVRGIKYPQSSQNVLTRLALNRLITVKFEPNCVAMGNKQSHPCNDLLEAYVKCMEIHEGVRPDPYEPEWCEVEKDAYRECREKLKAATPHASGNR